MEGLSEMAGNLKAELLNVREGLRLGEISAEAALQRVATVRQRRLKGLEPQQERFFSRKSTEDLKPEFSQRWPVGSGMPMFRTADTGREI